MKVQTTKFKAALGVVMPAVARRTTLPILGHVCLSVDGDEMKVSATNLETGITCVVPVFDAEDGAVTIPARLLYDYVSVLEGAEISLNIDDERNNVAIEAIQNEAKIKGLGVQDFPVIPEPEGAVFELSQATLEFLVGRAMVAAASDESRMVLTGIFTELSGNTVKMVSADGFRLSEVKSVQEWESGNMSALIPARSVDALMKMCAAFPEDVVKMSLSESRAFFNVGDAAMVTNLIEGHFPDYGQIIPKTWETKVVFEGVDELARAVKMLRLINFVLRFKIGDGKVVIDCADAELGEGHVEVDAEIEGPGLEIGLSAEYLNDALSVMWKEQPVEVWFTTSSAPALFKQGENFQYVLMPLSLGK